ncbi:MAG: 3-oxoacyl-[acyl-carrier-protein] reductase [Gemmatimonadales bacterium]|nr:MAG: 3-oxoacyl-[acyl-carrier-protein] reductase [Gemmatimonadales bacterium]
MSEGGSNEVALVTGGSRGIGLAIANALADSGALVAVIGRNEAAAVAAADGLPGSGHAGWACDVADSEAVNRTVKEIEQSLGPISILVNNAGVTRDNILLRLKDEDWDAVMEVNLRGAFNMTRAVTRGMMKRRDGVILNITSVVGLTGNAGQSNYAASKAGLIGLTKSVARELASRGVRCNAIAPGYIETDMTGALDEQQTEALMSRIPLGRLGVPEDIAGVARFLAGPSARYITGQVITVDGGMVI